MSSKEKGAERPNYDKHIYALYKGDEYIMDGTIAEIAKARGIKRSSVRFMLYPSYKKRLEGRTADGREHQCLSLVRVE